MRKEVAPNNEYSLNTDKEIWNQIAQSDLDALSFLYKKHYSDLYNFGLKCCHDDQLTQDCIHDLFIRLWEKRGNIIIQRTIKSYIMTSLRRMIIKRLVAIKKQMAKEGEFPDGHEPGLSVQDLMIQSEIDISRKKQMEKSLKLLTARQKEIIYLRFYQEMSYDEIAETLSIKYQSVRNCVHESMKVLKNSITGLVFLIVGLGPHL